MVGEDGNVYEGRGWDQVGAHTYGYNTVGLGKGACIYNSHKQHFSNEDNWLYQLIYFYTMSKLKSYCYKFLHCPIKIYNGVDLDKHLDVHYI